MEDDKIRGNPQRHHRETSRGVDGGDFRQRGEAGESRTCGRAMARLGFRFAGNETGKEGNGVIDLRCWRLGGVLNVLYLNTNFWMLDMTF